MNADRPSPTTITAYVIGIAGALAIMLVLVVAMDHYTRTESVTQNRSEDRRKNLAAMRRVDTEALHSAPVWQDKAKGFVRLPIERAMELILQEYKNPAAARSNLIVRIDKATAVPPKPPEKPSPLE